MLGHLCIASFINQGIVFPLYLFGILGALAIHGKSVEEVQHLLEVSMAGMLSPEQQAALMTYTDMIRLHGVALMCAFALRTLVRFIGTLRMWHGWRDGFHIYTSAQLLGVLIPILIAGSETFGFFGFLLAVNWCYLYFTQLKFFKPLA